MGVCVSFASADPNLILPVGLLLGAATFLFVLGVLTYRLFEMDLVLWLRSAFPVLYANTGGRQLLAAFGDVPPFPADCVTFAKVTADATPATTQMCEKQPAAKVGHGIDQK